MSSLECGWSKGVVCEPGALEPPLASWALLHPVLLVYFIRNKPRLIESSHLR